MNTKTSKKHKSACDNTKSMNGGPEVFVLPPNLLEKLGIKLENIVASDKIPLAPNHVVEKEILSDDQIKVELDVRNQIKVSHNQNESSILETANLMRESVFLSPTFVSTVSNLIPGEVVIASPYRDLKKCGNSQERKKSVIPVLNDVLHNDHKTSTKVHSDVLITDRRVSSQNDTNVVEHIHNQLIRDCASLETSNKVVKETSPFGKNKNQHSIDKKKKPQNVTVIPVLNDVLYNDHKTSTKVQSDVSITERGVSSQNDNNVVKHIHNQPILDCVSFEISNKVVKESSPFGENKNVNQHLIDKNKKPLNVSVIPVLNDVLHNDHKTRTKVQSDVSIALQGVSSLNSSNEVEYIHIQPILDCVPLETSNVFVEESLPFGGNKDVNQQLVDEKKKIQNVLSLDHMIKNPENNVFLEGPKFTQNSKNKKINVIHEEVIDVTKLYGRKLKYTNVNNNVLTPVTVDMLLPTIQKSSDVAGSVKDGTVTNRSEIVISKSQTEVELQKSICSVVTDTEHINVSCDEGGKCDNTMDVTSKKVANKVIEVMRNTSSSICSTDINRVSDDLSTNNVASQNNNPIENFFTYSNQNQQEKCSNKNLEKPSIELNNYRSLETPIAHPSSQTSTGDTSNKLCKVFKTYTSQANDFNKGKKGINEKQLWNEDAVDMENNNAFSSIVPSDIEKFDSKSKCRSLKQKICINGVEKPGGEAGGTVEIKVNRVFEKVPKPEFKLPHKYQKQMMNSNPESTHSSHKTIKDVKVLKTYVRKNKNIHKLTPHFEVQLNMANDSSCSIDIPATGTNPDVIHRTEDFCLCGDYGQLRFYEYNGLYEHIHFWNHNDVTTNRDLVFSIYNNDDVTCTTCDNEDELMELTTESSDENSNDICWNGVFSDMNDDVDLIDDGQQQQQLAPVDKKLETVSSEAVLLSLEKREIRIDSMKHIKSGLTEIGAKRPQNDEKKPEKPIVPTVKASEGTEGNEIILATCSEAIKITRSQEFKTHGYNVVCESTAMDQVSNTQEEITKVPQKELKEITGSPELKTHESNVAETTALDPIPNLSADTTKKPKKKVKKITRSQKLRTYGSNAISESTTMEQISNTHEEITKTPEEELKETSQPKELERPGSDVVSESITMNEVSISNAVNEEIPTNPKEETQSQEFERPGSNVVSESTTMNKVSNSSAENKEKPTKKRGRPKKRKRSVAEEESSTASKKDVKCGICGQILNDVDWEGHSSKEHGFIAWKAGETLDFKNKDLRRKLENKIQNDGFLRCGFCNIEIKRCKKFISHVEQCSREKLHKSDRKRDRTRKSVEVEESEKYSRSSNFISCGVCMERVKETDWIVHICHQHNYMAWKDGESPLNLTDENLVEKHLYDIIKKYGSIICAKCGVDGKYGIKSIKKYLVHIKTCYRVDDVEGDKPLEEDRTIKIEVELPPPEAYIVKCGVCAKEVENTDWINHISQDHNYLAWQEGSPSLNLADKDQVWQHLYAITKLVDGLICSKCGRKRKYAKSYLSHIEECDGMVNDSALTISMNASQSSYNTSELESSDVNVIEKAICGVCSKTILVKEWIPHIQKKHKYIAWKKGEPPVISQDEDAIINHLNKIIQEYGCCLSCHKCGSSYGVEAVQTYLTHVDACKVEKKLETPIVKCGVCALDVENDLWMKHIESKHNYFAWKEGEPPLVLDDTESKRLYLMSLLDEIPAFRCARCGISKKYAKSFITHLEICGPAPESGFSEQDINTCAVCSEEVKSKNWRDHAMNDHYNIAWRVGEAPIDLKSTYGTEKYLKEYKQKKGKLACKICGTTRASAVGFYAHILACGKTEEELDEYRNVCEICNHKYVCIYKNQHMAWHREQDYKSVKELPDDEEEEVSFSDDVPLGRRKAAVKANKVLHKLKDVQEFQLTHSCAECGFETDSDRKWKRHKCGTETFETHTESEESDDSEESIDESDASKSVSEVDEPPEDVNDSLQKKRNRETAVQAKGPELPFKYKAANYVAQINEDFYKAHFTSETLFPQWHKSTYELLTQDQISGYLPTMEKSCRFKQNVEEWNTLNRFEAIPSPKGYTMFLGASIQCLSWIPPPFDESEDKSFNYLSVACHQGNDIPRYNYDELRSHSGLIQIWNFGKFTKDLPKFILGIVHDYGTVWAMDWCPSGARDINAKGEQEDWQRIGLLAIACSNGVVYILSVPHPSCIGDSDIYVRIKPVAELRISSKGKDRKPYQATAVAWSKQKGHTDVIVGYADGTTASFDLTTSSLLLVSSRNDLSVFYPYRDDREHNACISGVDTHPSGPGLVCSASLSGVSATLRPGAPTARVVSSAPATGAAFAPAWPSVLYSVDDIVASQAQCEVDWYGCGRRVGSVRQWSGCGRCGRALLHVPPLLRVLPTLPPYTDSKRQNVLDIRVISLSNKRKLENDELSMVMEPLTYEDAVTQYGVQISFLNQKDRNILTTRDVFSERFPLSDVAAMAFCPSAKHHTRAAVGLRAGLLLLVRVL